MKPLNDCVVKGENLASRSARGFNAEDEKRGPTAEAWQRTQHAAPDPLTAAASWADVIELRPEGWRARAFAAIWSPDDPVA